MATWGKITRRINEYDPPSTMYYEYSTVTDSYYIKTIINKDFGMGNEKFESEDYFDNEYGECLMEALINHILAFECVSEEHFIEKYIKNNRFRKDEE